MTDEVIDSTRLHHAMVELTTDCNLRCSYCAVSGKDWEFKDLDLTLIDKIIDNLQQLNTKSIIIHGHGETTIVEKWVNVAQKFQSAGFDLIICTNLAKAFTDEEFETLANFHQITVSIDTIDPHLFKQLRRGGDVYKIIYNMSIIRSIQRHNIRWIWSSVVCDKTIWGMPKLIKLGRVLGVNTFCFCNLTIEPGVTLKHLSQLTVDEARSARRILDEIEAYGLEYNLEIDIKSGLVDTLAKVCAITA